MSKPREGSDRVRARSIQSNAQSANWVALGVAAAVLTQHFQILSLGGYPLTLGAILGIMLLLVASRRIPLLALTICLCAVTGYASLVALIANSTSSDGAQFFRTLILVIASTAIIALSFSQFRAPLSIRLGLARGLFLALSVTVAMAAAQVVLGASGNETLFNPFGSRQYLYSYNPQIQFNPIPRAQGFFLEPSYLSFVVGALSVSLLIMRHRSAWVLLLCVGGLVLARSATGLIIAAVIALIFVLRSKSSVAIGIVVLAVPAIFIVGANIVERLESITTVGSSANFRLLAPLQVLNDILVMQPLGLPLGSIDRVLLRYSLLNGQTVGASLDNGVYVLVYYFGWVGLIGILLALMLVLRQVLRTQFSSTRGWIAPVWIFGSLFFSGGVFLPEFALMCSLVIVSHRLAADQDHSGYMKEWKR